jgi:hypothetical protein
LNPGRGLGRQDFLLENQVQNPDTCFSFLSVNIEDVKKYFVYRELKGISKSWIDKSRHWIIEYLDSVNWKIEENSTLSYLKGIQSSVGSSYYRKKTLQIRRFLIYLNINRAHSISLPSEPCNSIPIRNNNG